MRPRGLSHVHAAPMKDATERAHFSELMAANTALLTTFRRSAEGPLLWSFLLYRLRGKAMRSYEVTPPGPTLETHD